jgi:hypothetical protein
MDLDFKRGLWYGMFSPTPVLPMSWWWEYFDTRLMTPYFRGVREINDKMLASGNGSFESLKIEAGNSHAFSVKCGDDIYVYVYNTENSVLISDVVISSEGNAKYNAQSFEPTSMVYREVTNISSSDSNIVLNKIRLGSQKEIIYILSPMKKL